MFKCFDNNKLQNEILNCDQCNVPFNVYDQPKFLPCGSTCVNENDLNTRILDLNKEKEKVVS